MLDGVGDVGQSLAGSLQPRHRPRSLLLQATIDAVPQAVDEGQRHSGQSIARRATCDDRVRAGWGRPPYRLPRQTEGTQPSGDSCSSDGCCKGAGSSDWFGPLKPEQIFGPSR